MVAGEATPPDVAQRRMGLVGGEGGAALTGQLGQCIASLVKSGDTGGLQRLYESGTTPGLDTTVHEVALPFGLNRPGWRDLEMAVSSAIQADGNVWHRTALCVAVSFAQLKVMRWLIQKGARVNETRDYFHLPSNLAAAKAFRRGLEALKDAGTNMSREDADGFAPVHHASLNGHVTILRLLHSWGETMDVKNKQHHSAASFAARRGSSCSDFLKLVSIESRGERRTGKKLKDAVRPTRERDLRLLAEANGYTESKLHLAGQGAEETGAPSRKCLVFYRGHVKGCFPLRHTFYLNTGTCVSAMPEKVPFEEADGNVLFERSTIVQRGLDSAGIELLLKDPFESVYQAAAKRMEERPGLALEPIKACSHRSFQPRGVRTAQPATRASMRLEPLNETCLGL
jgi:hypothetical protein